jgi:hypothetical protein
MLHFLLTYSLTEGRLVDLKQFEDGKAAGRAYVEAEERNRRDDDVEVVLVGADSLEALKTTHAHYFDGDPDSASKYLAGV